MRTGILDIGAKCLKEEIQDAYFDLQEIESLQKKFHALTPTDTRVGINFLGRQTRNRIRRMEKRLEKVDHPFRGIRNELERLFPALGTDAEMPGGDTVEILSAYYNEINTEIKNYDEQ